MADEAGAQTLAEPVIIDETNNAAVAVGAAMARAVIAAELYRQTGALPVWVYYTEGDASSK